MIALPISIIAFGKYQRSYDCVWALNQKAREAKIEEIKGQWLVWAMGLSLAWFALIVMIIFLIETVRDL